jgi:hypothetical protein
MLLAVMGRPDLWGSALGLGLRMVPSSWWRRRPRRPWPDPGLWEFRMVAAYGDPDARPEPDDLVTFLEWCRENRPSRRRNG